MNQEILKTSSTIYLRLNQQNNVSFEQAKYAYASNILHHQVPLTYHANQSPGTKTKPGSSYDIRITFFQPGNFSQVLKLAIMASCKMQNSTMPIKSQLLHFLPKVHLH